MERFLLDNFLRRDVPSESLGPNSGLVSPDTMQKCISTLLRSNELALQNHKQVLQNHDKAIEVSHEKPCEVRNSVLHRQ